MNGALLSKKCTLSDLALDMCVSLVIWKEKKREKGWKGFFCIGQYWCGFFSFPHCKFILGDIDFFWCVSVNSAYCRWTSANEVVMELFPDLEKRMKESH